MNPKSPYCLECQDDIQGRSDKKFCSDSCRIAFHNRKRIESVQTVRSVNLILNRNRSILLDFLGSKKNHTVLNHSQLALRGFDFAFTTHQTKDALGNTVSYCYEVGYLMLNTAKVRVVRNAV